MDFSVVISSYNNINKLRLTLKFLLLQQGIDKYEIEIVIIDDCSTEDVATGINDIITNVKYYKSIRIFRNEINMGLAASRNIGASYCVSDFILFLDNDIILSPNLLQYHIEGHKVGSTNMIVSRIYDINRNNFKRIISELNTMDYLNESFLQDNLEVEMDPFYEIREEILNVKELSQNSIWFFATFFCTSVTKDMFHKLKGFDTNYKGWGPEDIDFSYRVYKEGYTIKYCNKAVCYHMDDGTKDVNVLVRDISRNLKYLSFKFPNKEIENYIKLYKGSTSFEEFDAFMNGKQFLHEDYENLHKIGILKYIQFKSKLS